MANYYISQGGSRILNATRVDLSGADNTNIIGWVKTNDFIIAININSNGKDTEAAQYKLRWRNKTDGGSFADAGAATEINYNATTDLVNGDPIAVGGRKCDSQGGDTWAAGEEVEGASISDSIDLADEYETEIHFALDCSGATDAKEYEFELYDSTLGVTRGTCGATITMESGLITKEFTIDANLVAWLSGWSYRKEITITGQSGAGTYYQVDLGVGDSAGGDFHLEGNCTNFPQDIIVTDNDGTTLLDYWIEDITADPLKLWVEVADDLGSNQTIYVYYGKSGATTDSSGADTFLQFHGAATSNFIDSLTVSPTCIFEAKARTTSTTSIIRWGLANNQEPTTDDCMFIMSHYSADLRYIQCDNESVTSNKAEAPKFVQDTWYNLKIINTGSAVTGFVDDDQISTGDITTNLPNENLGLFMQNHTSTGAQEWSFARKYNSTEPAFSSAGSEQTSGGATETKDFSIDSILKATNTKDFTTDAYLQSTETKEFTVDGYLVDRLTKDFTADAALKATETKEFSIDAYLQSTEIKEFTIDSILVSTGTKEFSIDTILKATNTKEFTIDTHLVSTGTKEFTTDSLLVDRLTKEFTTDSFLINRGTKDFTTDAYLLATFTKEFTTDAVIKATEIKEFSVDAILEATETKTLSLDAILLSTTTKDFSINGILEATNTKDFTTDSLLVNRFTKDFSTDSLLVDRFTKEYTTDSILVTRGTKEYTVDAVLQGTSTKEFGMDAIITSATTKQFSVDAHLQSTESKQVSIDAILKATGTKGFTFDGILVSIGTKVFTTGGILEATNSKEFTIDSHLVNRYTKDFTTDSLLVDRLTKEFTIDSLLINRFTKDYTINAILNKTSSKEFTTDAVLQSTETKDISTDAILQLTSTNEFSIDSYLINQYTKEFNTDSILEATQTKEFTIDARLSISTTYYKEFTIDAILIPLVVTTPDRRTVVIPAENRIVVITIDNRTIVIPAENRTVVIAADNNN